MTTAFIRRIAGIGLVAAAAVGCSETAREGRSPAYLLLDRLEAASGADPGELSTTLQSDVITQGGILEDPAAATFRLALKDVGPQGAASAPTTNNFITVTRYRVTYRRTDGRNTPGVDVPYPFEGSATITVGASPVSLSFILVRAVAKLEPPLRNLQGGGQSGGIYTIADVTFFGKDQTGNDVSVTGAISVNFADWADPDAS
jgi:hypothetical protein